MNIKVRFARVKNIKEDGLFDNVELFSKIKLWNDLFKVILYMYII